MTSPVGASHRSAREILGSQIIGLEPSDSNTTLHVHEQLLRSISPVLLVACSKEWKEKTTMHYKFYEDVTEPVLLGFLTWVYCGDYHVGNDEDPYIWNSSPPAKTQKVTKKKELPWTCDILQTVQGEVEDKLETSMQKVDAASGVSTPEGYLHPLLLHIKLYVLAETYMIKDLKALTRQNIIDQFKTLRTLGEVHEREAVFDVLKYAFSSRLPEQDFMLHWLARYASWKLEELKQLPSFDKLISETDGTLATLLMRYVQRSSVSPFDLKAEDIVPRYPNLGARR